ncbi:MAG TPA: hypothetical protein PLH75_10790, partial [Amaricoccus sp.]|nr:hypothetical protein [Amaricoccus sp.]
DRRGLAARAGAAGHAAARAGSFSLSQMRKQANADFNIGAQHDLKNRLPLAGINAISTMNAPSDMV